MTRKEVVNGFYAQYDEAGRLESDKQGEVEYIVTMNYIHRYLKPGMKVAEISERLGEGYKSVEHRLGAARKAVRRQLRGIA